jgi:PHD/YefM family antitoxin component YafN of YafNO toxin-antitoxin module
MLLMYQVTLDYAKDHLDELCDRASKEAEGVAIVRENQSYVLISQGKWESLLETAELLQIPGILEQVEAARRNY